MSHLECVEKEKKKVSPYTGPRRVSERKRETVDEFREDEDSVVNVDAQEVTLRSMFTMKKLFRVYYVIW